MTRSMRMSLAVLGTASMVTFSFGCEEIPAPYVIECASLETFQPDVSSLLEKRCGTLDCHGTLARPLRIYGQGGLRLALPEEIEDFALARDNDTVSGGKGTTPEEFEANWRSVCGLEPEAWRRVIAGESEPIELLLLSKPLGPDVDDGHTHKGGAVVEKGNTGYDCIESWVAGEVDVGACQEATADL